MAKSKWLFAAVSGLVLSIFVILQTDMTVQAESNAYLEDIRGGIAALFNPVVSNSLQVTEEIKSLRTSLESQTEQNEIGKLVMANVKSAMNVRCEPTTESDRVGTLYKDCGGVILDRKDGWTKLQSGNIVGWASDEYLLFGDDAIALANDVGKRIATVTAESLRVRREPGTEAEVLGLLPKGEIVEVIHNDEETGWACVDFEGGDGYVSSEYISIDFVIGNGETVEETKAREDAEREAKRHKNFGAYTTDADTTLLLAALIHCEARGESYEGQVAVGAVVMNRVRSKAYPDSIHGVIYASGQFTPAMTGKLNQVYESGKINESCIRAAEEALSGVSNVGDMTHFRRNNGRDGLVIGNHVFY